MEILDLLPVVAAAARINLQVPAMEPVAQVGLARFL
jgi:hypothetical protein